MASSSTAAIPKRFKYDVFLSFRGEDTRKSFISHLYRALDEKSIITYKDDKAIEKGRNISDELIRAIKNSKFYIIVFSKDYASSGWCLNELVKMMDCHKTTEHTAYPVFYDVEPTEVRKQIGAVGEAFDKHRNDDAAGKWMEALKEAADLAGRELKSTVNGNEAEFIQLIVKDILDKIRSTVLDTDKKLVGMETRINNVVSSFGTGVDDVRMIGIWGIGGDGKTTLARAVYNQISYQFEGKSFVENVRENASSHGLTSLQDQVLGDVLNDPHIKAKGRMNRMMSGKKVLLVLDDVDDIDQLEALAREPNWFKSGSRIIITTRDKQVLAAHQVELTFDVKLLLHNEASCLFSRYAFWRELPIQGYEELTEKVVEYADGLPLTIKVMGSFLCGKKDKRVWTNYLERLKEFPLERTLKILELSYLSLEEEDYREMFLDVACLLRHWPKDLAVKALESRGFYATVGLEALEEKSLITISRKYGCEYVDMHDHLQEMGRDIVRRSYRQKPSEHSRLWIDKEIKMILANDLGTKATRCIDFQSKKFNPKIIMKGLIKMEELRFLSVSAEYVDDANCFPLNVSQYFSNALQYLSWYEYPFTFLPETFKGDNLVSLMMPRSKIVQLWEGGDRKALKKLKFLNLSYSMLTTLDLGLFPKLEMLTLKGCRDLVQLHKLNGCLNLISVYLSQSKLKTVDLHAAVNLELLDLENCYALVKLHLPDGCLKLTYPYCTWSKLKTLDIRRSLNLETLILRGSRDLVKLQMPNECPNLRSLKLTQSKLRTLDIGLTRNLNKLDLRDCYNLEELHMADKCQKLESLKLTKSKLRTLDLGLTPNLEKLDLKECNNLVEVNAPTGCLENISYLNLSGCLRFTSFLFDKSFRPSSRMDKSLEDGPSAKSHLIAVSLKRCPLHPGNTSQKLQFVSYYKDDPSLTRNLETLISIGLCACTNLETFSRSICGLRHLKKLTVKGYQEAPRDFYQLECLEPLQLSSLMNGHLPYSICMLKHLKYLKLDSCWLLQELPEDLGLLECLEELTLSLEKIIQLPDSICMLKHLKVLELSNCLALEKLPEDFGKLECLATLNLYSTKIRYLPNTFCMLKGLRSVNLDHCSLLQKLPWDLDRLGCLELLSLVQCTSLKDIPNSICEMKCLKELNIEGTCIDLPRSLGLLKGLSIRYGEFGYVDL